MSELGDWDWHIHTVLYKINNWEPAVEHRDLSSVLCGALNVNFKVNLKKSGYMYMCNKFTLLYGRKLMQYCKATLPKQN